MLMISAAPPGVLSKHWQQSHLVWPERCEKIAKSTSNQHFN